jgi:anti-sigma factor RsiW
MNCRDVREIGDSFLSEQLLTETNHEILRHLENCQACRAELDARRRLRGVLRAAFNHAPELQPSAEFQNRLRTHLRDVSARGASPGSLSRRWLALAAGIVLVVAAYGIFRLWGSVGSAEALAREAVGDHQNCALKYRLARMPVPLDEAARRFDGAFRVLLSAPSDAISTPNGVARVTERHSCVYGTRRFGHVIMEYRGRVVSLLMTANDTGAGTVERDAIPHVIGRAMDGLSVVSVNGSRHAIMFVGDLGTDELTQLSEAVSVPLVRRLEAATLNPVGWSGSSTALLLARR